MFNERLRIERLAHLQVCEQGHWLLLPGLPRIGQASVTDVYNSHRQIFRGPNRHDYSNHCSDAGNTNGD
jgi:hypothetical protein